MQNVLSQQGHRSYREGYRTPMQWTGEANAGFTDAGVTPWLAVNPDAAEVNVKAQTDGAAGSSSHLQVSFYSSLLTLSRFESRAMRLKEI